MFRNLPSTNSFKSLASLDDGGLRPVQSFKPAHADPCLDPSVVRDMLVNRSVLDVRDLMVESGTALDMPLFPHSHTLLTFAIAFEPEAVENLLQDSRICVNAKDGHGDLPLVLALRNRTLFNALAARSETDINARDQRGNTALIEAASLGELAAVELLLKDHRLDVDAYAQGARALSGAEARRHDQVVEAIVRELTDDPEGGGRLERMLQRGTWMLLGAKPGYYYAEDGQLVGITNARELTVLYMQRLKDIYFIEDPAFRELQQGIVGRAYDTLLPRYRKKPG